MATVTLVVGHIADGNEVLMNIQSPKQPLSKAACVIAQEYEVGVDFTSGDDLVLEMPGISKIQVAIATSPAGVIKGYTQAADSSGTGLKLTFSTVTTNLKIFIITDI